MKTFIIAYLKILQNVILSNKNKYAKKKQRLFKLRMNKMLKIFNKFLK